MKLRWLHNALCVLRNKNCEAETAALLPQRPQLAGMATVVSLLLPSAGQLSHCTQVGCNMFATGNKPDVKHSSRLSHQPQHICPEATQTQHFTHVCPSLIYVVSMSERHYYGIIPSVSKTELLKCEFKYIIHLLTDLPNLFIVIHHWIMELN